MQSLIVALGAAEEAKNTLATTTTTLNFKPLAKLNQRTCIFYFLSLNVMARQAPNQIGEKQPDKNTKLDFDT
ncbi:MAG: hypothetical protein JKX78_12680 [Alteromonadaceae bacterium]|nr:hypothetical protein [Alteromonadaceae bacterium]